MVKVDPRPGPSLEAVSRPPCRSTIDRLIARPRPSPPDRRAASAPPCSNISKIRGSTAASIPAPVSLTSTISRPPARLAVSVDLAGGPRPPVSGPDRHRPALRGELDRILQQVPHHLLQPDRVAVDVVAAGGEVQRQPQTPRPRTSSRQISPTRWISSCAFDHLALQVQLAAADAGQVEQVVDQPDLHVDVPPDHLHHRPERLGRLGPLEDRRDRRQDRAQRRAELVAQGRQEPVLGPVGRLGLRPRRLLAERPDPLPLGPLRRADVAEHQHPAVGGRRPPDGPGGRPCRPPSREIRASKTEASPFGPDQLEGRLARGRRSGPAGRPAPAIGRRPTPPRTPAPRSRLPPDQPLGGRVQLHDPAVARRSRPPRRPSPAPPPPTPPASGPAAGIATSRAGTPARSPRTPIATVSRWMKPKTRNMSMMFTTHGSSTPKSMIAAWARKTPLDRIHRPGQQDRRDGRQRITVDELAPRTPVRTPAWRSRSAPIVVLTIDLQ